MATENRINLVNIDLIKSYWRNPRKSDDAVPFVANSIARYGFNVPIVVDAKNVIILGHTRYRAARQLNLKEVPVIVANLTDQQAREFRIADNKTSELAQWDPAKLTDELKSLTDLATVNQLFGTPEWDAILNPPQPIPPQAAGATTSGVAGATNGADPQDGCFEVTCPYCSHLNIIKPEVVA